MRRRRRNPKLLSLTNIALGVGLFYAYKKGWLSKLTDSFKEGRPYDPRPFLDGPSPPESPDSPGIGYAWCADENQNCAFAGSRSVAFGAPGKWTYRTLSDGAHCDLSVFPDPAPGVRKKCYVK